MLNDNIYVKFGNNYFEPGLGLGFNSNIVSEMTLKMQLNKNRQELISELEQTYYQTIKSIKKYGGFYIGRYETGIQDDIAVIKKMNENLSNQSWIQMYQKTQKLRGEKDNIITSMIWSSLWDYTIDWLVKTGAQTYSTIYLSDTWGNYTNSQFEYYADIDGNTLKKNTGSSNAKTIPAGSSEYTKSNNIYDLAGNVNELTLGCYAQYFTYRGGSYASSATEEMSCAYRNYQSISNETIRVGSRAILLLK